MLDTVEAGDRSSSIVSGERYTEIPMPMPMRSLGSVVRPIMKNLIVNRAIAGKLTPQEAERLIAKHGLRHA